MKYLSLYCWLIITSLTSTLSAQVFVKADATGANNGSSWADAFTELSTAIELSQEGAQIWVAAGTYVPGNTPSASFSLTENLQLYGGFAGTETQLADRDASVNLTILSGDILGDDLIDDWTTNKTDNARTVLTISSIVDTFTIIDGFIIRDGYDDRATPLAGGIYSTGNPIIRSCVFTRNYTAGNGAGIHLDDLEAAGAIVSFCTFIDNKANVHGGGIALDSVLVSETFLEGCQFEDNFAAKNGGGVYALNSPLSAEASNYIQNTAETLGGGLYVLQSNGNSDFSFEDCEFDNNAGTVGGAVYMRMGASQITFSFHDCSFRNNSASDLRSGFRPSGGGIRIYYDPNSSDCSTSLISCEFENNSAFNLGAGVANLFTGQNCSTLVDSCIFLSGTLSSPSFAGGAGLHSLGGNHPAYLEVQHTQFLSNSGGWGGALTLTAATDFELEAWVNECTFTNNASLLIGPGLTISGEPPATSMDVLVENSSFEGNYFLPNSNSDNIGGGMGISNSINDFQATVRNCVFTANENPKGGAAFEVGQLTGLPAAPDMEVLVEGSLFTGQTNGQAVLQFEPSSNTVLSNVTIADNSIVGVKVNNDASVQLRNSILHSVSPLIPCVEVVGLGSLSSLGGNLISDFSAGSFLTGQDSSGVDPMFERTGDHPHQLSMTSPAIDLGVSYPGLDSMALDIAGNLRFQGSSVDAGAYESPYSIVIETIRDQLDETATLRLYPVPVLQRATLELENDWHGHIQLMVYNSIGQMILGETLMKNNRQVRWELELGQLAAGTYRLVLTDGQATVVKSFSKAEF